MPIISEPGYPALKQQIKAAFDSAVVAAGGTVGSLTSDINDNLADQIAGAIQTYVKAAQLVVFVNGAATPDAAGGVVTGQGTG